MNSFECNKCSYNTIRNYDLTRHLKNVHGIHVNMSVKGNNEPQAGLPSRRSEEKQYGGESHRQQSRMDEEEEEEEEEEDDEPRTNPVDALYSPEEFEKFGHDMARRKCRILDCVLDTFPEHLKTKAKRMCDTLKM